MDGQLCAIWQPYKKNLVSHPRPEKNWNFTFLKFILHSFSKIILKSSLNFFIFAQNYFTSETVIRVLRQSERCRWRLLEIGQKSGL